MRWHNEAEDVLAVFVLDDGDIVGADVGCIVGGEHSDNNSIGKQPDALMSGPQTA